MQLEVFKWVVMNISLWFSEYKLGLNSSKHLCDFTCILDIVLVRVFMVYCCFISRDEKLNWHPLCLMSRKEHAFHSWEGKVDLFGSSWHTDCLIKGLKYQSREIYANKSKFFFFFPPFRYFWNIFLFIMVVLTLCFHSFALIT